MNHDDMHFNEQRSRIREIKEALETADYHATHYVNLSISKSLYHEETARSNKDAQTMALPTFLINKLMSNMDDI